MSSACFIAFVIWAAVSPLDIVSTASGEVIPSTKVKSIQHLEGGIVGEILIREGQRVAVGQELITLEETAQGSNVEELDVRLASLRADVTRLKAEEKGKAVPVFGEDFEKKQPKLAAEAKRLFKTRRERLEGEKAAKRESVIQREQDVREIKARIKNAKTSLRLVQEQVAISEELLKDSLTTKYKHLSFLKEESQLKSKLEEDRAALSRAESELVEAGEKLKSLDKAFRAKAGE
jgi:adhesin transport system membrane fusion protein